MVLDAAPAISRGETGQGTRRTHGHSHQETINLRSTFLDREGPSPEIMTHTSNLPRPPPSEHVKNCPHYLCNNILKYCSASGAVFVATLTSRGSAAQTRDGNSNTFPQSSPLICHQSSPIVIIHLPPVSPDVIAPLRRRSSRTPRGICEIFPARLTVNCLHAL